MPADQAEHVRKLAALRSDAGVHVHSAWRSVRKSLAFSTLIRSLKNHPNTEAYYRHVRSMHVDDLTTVQRASRFVFLNKTCFNGLYRENKSGQFNVPYGHYANPRIVDEANLLAVSHYMRNHPIEILYSSYQHILNGSHAGDLVYLDPPYVPISRTANFVGYAKGGFTLADQAVLADTFAELDRRGIKLMLSNSNTEVVRHLYAAFRIQMVHATRAINCNGALRGKEANEVLITNY